MSDKQILELILDSGAETVEAIGKSFRDPDADWNPAALLVTRDGRRWSAEHLPLVFAGTDDKRRIFSTELPAAIFRTRATAVMILGSVWYVSPEEYEPGTAVSDHPERSELLVLSAFTTGEHRTRVAGIRRFEYRPPELEEWVEVEGNISRFDGNLYRPVVEALRAAQVSVN